MFDAATVNLLLICAALAVIILLIIHKYLSRNRLPARRQNINEIPLGPLFGSEEEEEEKEEKGGQQAEQQEERINEEPTAAAGERQSSKPEPDNRNVISITLRSRRREGFNGKQLLATFTKFNLEYGDMHIFHRIIRAGEKKDVSFSVLNGVEPGTLNPQEVQEANIPAIIFFIRLHSCNQPLKAFAEMTDVAQQFGHLLDGQLFDDQGSHLSPQTIVYYKDLIREFLLARQAPPQDDRH